MALALGNGKGILLVRQIGKGILLVRQIEVPKSMFMLTILRGNSNFFLTVKQFYTNIDEKRVGKCLQEISTRPTFRNILTNLKETR